MFAVVVVSLIIKLIILNRLKVNSVWELILEYNFAYFVTPFKVIQQFEKAQDVCKRKTIERNFVVIELRYLVQKSKRQS